MKIDKVNINNLLPFNENPYRIREGEELESLLNSITVMNLPKQKICVQAKNSLQRLSVSLCRWKLSRQHF